MRFGCTALSNSRLWSLALALALAAAAPLAGGAVFAQGKASEQAQRGAAAVSILIEAPGEGDDRAIEAANDLARHFARNGMIRVLPIIGRGVASNVRDQLYQRGVDFAILGSDTFAYLDQIGQLREARGRMRLITHLYDRRLLLFTRPPIGGIADLAGKRVAVISSGSSAHAMATTVLGLLAVPARLEAVTLATLQDARALAQFDGILLLDHDLARQPVLAATQGLVLRPIASTTNLDKVYHRGLVLPSELPSAKLEMPLETVAASTLLVSFDWNPSHARYEEIRRFISALFVALPALKREAGTSIWRHSNVVARPLGWTRHALALPERALSEEQRVLLTTSDVLPRIVVPSAVVPDTSATLPSASAASASVPTPLARVAALAEPGAAGAAAAIPPVPAQSPTTAPAAASPAKIIVRAAVAERAPLVERSAPEGGILVDLLRQGLAATEPAGAPGAALDVVWSSAGASEQAGAAVDLVLPWEQADCDRPNELSRISAVLCDTAIASDPMLQVVIGLFGAADRPFDIGGADVSRSRIVCLEESRDSADLNSGGRLWLAEKRAVVMRRGSLIECVGAVASGDADAFVASDLEARHLLRRLGLTAQFRMSEQPLATRSLHAAIAADRPGALEVVRRINAGLAELKRTGAYASVVKRHLMSLWSGETARLE